MKILITGFAGFIGFHASRELLRRGWEVVGIDNFCDYYNVKLKRDRAALLEGQPGFSARELDICDHAKLHGVFTMEAPDVVLNLAAQPGVRYSIDHPFVYEKTNLEGFLNVLECCRHAAKVPKLVYASSSSVYGGNKKMPFEESDKVDNPVSLYAATKKANEEMGHAWAHINQLPITLFRFFTVYGPWGRPDMAPFKFTRGILEGRPIDVYNHGKMWRDFTYVGDLVRGIRLLMDAVPGGPETAVEGDSLSPVAPYRIVNIGNSSKVRLEDFIEAIERATGKQAIRNYMDMQPGDIPATWADCTLLQRLTGYQPQTDIRDGMERFVEWYREYYGR